MDIQIKTRFAPSPTGLMHFGNLRTGLFNYLYAKRFGGIFLLRIEDTDASRSEKQYSEAIMSDLRWFGLEWQEGPYYQSERQAIYNQYYQALEQKGRVYPCFCSEEQLAITRKVQLASGQPPRYPGTCRHLSKEKIQAKQAEGIAPTLRFEVPRGEIVQFEDLVKGTQRFDTDHIGDFIVRRNDGSAPFMFCNAIDDAMMGITHALRGDDHLTNTPRQILILQALGLPVIQYGHFPTILGPDGHRLSKRNGSWSIQELREAGFLPLGVVNYLSRLGHHDNDPNLIDLNTMSQHFDLANISSSPAHYDPAQLNYWQKEAMHRSNSNDCWKLIAPNVKEWVPEELAIPFVDAIQPNLIMPKDAVPLAKAIFSDTLSYDEEIQKVIHEAGADFFNCAIQLLEDSHLNSQTLINGLQQKTGRKGKALFFPIRAALMADLHGPELAKVLTLMGIEKVRARFAKAAQYAASL